ncbi:ArsR/SmtB family transcription factor [Halocatena marina]|uniref:ArsR/SmtB family transcription factor n=1 Tax=Halocatena marina TaxID=2934937 RepID=UPI00200DC09C|nr:metalloregulator ArsR/SmtB family transcription factor [Halocatena marina]
MDQSKQELSTGTDSGNKDESQACCTPVSSPEADVLKSDVTILSALANETRYGALRVLADAENDICACDLAPPLDVTQSTISHALSQLHDVGLVERRKEGRWRYYWPTPFAEAILAVLEEREVYQ